MDEGISLEVERVCGGRGCCYSKLGWLPLHCGTLAIAVVSVKLGWFALHCGILAITVASAKLRWLALHCGTLAIAITSAKFG